MNIRALLKEIWDASAYTMPFAGTRVNPEKPDPAPRQKVRPPETDSILDAIAQDFFGRSPKKNKNRWGIKK